MGNLSSDNRIFFYHFRLTELIFNQYIVHVRIVVNTECIQLQYVYILHSSGDIGTKCCPYLKSEIHISYFGIQLMLSSNLIYSFSRRLAHWCMQSCRQWIVELFVELSNGLFDLRRQPFISVYLQLIIFHIMIVGRKNWLVLRWQYSVRSTSILL